MTAYIVAFIKDYQLAAILISLIPAYFLMSFVGSYYIEKYSALMSDYAATAASIASEALSNIVVVQAFGANNRLEKKFSHALKQSETEGLKKATAVGINQASYISSRTLQMAWRSGREASASPRQSARAPGVSP